MMKGGMMKLSNVQLKIMEEYADQNYKKNNLRIAFIDGVEFTLKLVESMQIFKDGYNKGKKETIQKELLNEVLLENAKHREALKGE